MTGMKRKTALEIIKTEFAEHGKETAASTRAYVENQIGFAAYMEARRTGLNIYKDAHNG